MLTYIEQYFQEAKIILDKIDRKALEAVLDLLCKTRSRKGRVFFLGVGGSAANASHAVNDFRKICGIECYSPTDNVSELTARINDDGWDSCFANWLQISRLQKKDLVFVFSVGGGDLEKKVSLSIVKALQYAQKTGAGICGVVSRNGGYTAKAADACVVIPVINAHTVTPHAEAFQAVVWHLLVAHPKLQKNQMKWESIK